MPQFPFLGRPELFLFDPVLSATIYAIPADRTTQASRITAINKNLLLSCSFIISIYFKVAEHNILNELKDDDEVF